MSDARSLPTAPPGAVDRAADGHAGRADPPLPAAVPLLLEPAGAGEGGNGELTTAEWCRVLDEAAELGVLQLHLSGGEPTLRRDLEAIVAHAARSRPLHQPDHGRRAARRGARGAPCKAAGLDHVQLSPPGGRRRDRRPRRRLQGRAREEARGRRAGSAPPACRSRSTPSSTARTSTGSRRMIELALELGAHRLEVAHVQYYGWALRNRAALMPTRAQLEQTTELVERKRAELKGRLAIDYVDARLLRQAPEALHGRLGPHGPERRPEGPRPALPRGGEHRRASSSTACATGRCAEIWQASPAFQALPRHRVDAGALPLLRAAGAVDFGGCRCQAMALTGDARNTDPACELSPHHARIFSLAEAKSAAEPPPFVYRRIGAATQQVAAAAAPACYVSRASSGHSPRSALPARSPLPYSASSSSRRARSPRSAAVSSASAIDGLRPDSAQPVQQTSAGASQAFAVRPSVSAAAAAARPAPSSRLACGSDGPHRRQALLARGPKAGAARPRPARPRARPARISRPAHPTSDTPT